MHCPFCQHVDTRVIDSRVSDDGATIRRRRECEACGERFSTLETIELKLPAKARTAKRGTLTLSYAGNGTYAAQTLRRTVTTR